MDPTEDEEFGREPLDMAVALSDSEVFRSTLGGFLGDSGAGTMTGSRVGVGAIVVGETTISAGAPRSLRSATVVATGVPSNLPVFRSLGLEFGVVLAVVAGPSKRAPDRKLGLEFALFPDLSPEIGTSTVCCTDGSVLLRCPLDIERRAELCAEDGLLLKSV